MPTACAMRRSAATAMSRASLEQRPRYYECQTHCHFSTRRSPSRMQMHAQSIHVNPAASIRIPRRRPIPVSPPPPQTHRRKHQHHPRPIHRPRNERLAVLWACSHSLAGCSASPLAASSGFRGDIKDRSLPANRLSVALPSRRSPPSGVDVCGCVSAAAGEKQGWAGGGGEAMSGSPSCGRAATAWQVARRRPWQRAPASEVI